jgi:hypothetical protein
VNIGVNAGVLGWVVGLCAFFPGVVAHASHRRRSLPVAIRPAYIRHCGITLALLAALMNAFFHNSGVIQSRPDDELPHRSADRRLSAGAA